MSSDDVAVMRLALETSRLSRRSAPPNPWVGAVLVAADGREIARGATAPVGGPHAEVHALANAGSAAQGATMYVTLEPCSHHGRTPPCVDAIIEAGVARVVVGIEDPDERVRGQGVARLRDAGVAVTVGVLADEIAIELAPYLWHRRTGRPFVVAKVAATLDGAVAMADGTSQWITSTAARRDAHELRALSQAIVVGANTVRTDNPRLTARTSEGVFEPLRVVLGTAPDDANVHPCWQRSGDLGVILDELGAHGILQVLVEGGPTVTSAFLEKGLVNRLVWYAAPAFAGSDGRPALGGLRTATIAALRRGRIQGIRQVGDDVRIDVEV
jgi:diaminohydroxyphosphoribosylaminopyrimidine deaminase/5-amino-6-(5-phosphoribosylamino)uracil reductase